MTTIDIINPANLVYAKTKVMNDVPMHYCPGCSHGVVHKLIAEVIEDMDVVITSYSIHYTKLYEFIIAYQHFC